MPQHRPNIVVFYGGPSSNYDLSRQTGFWVCQYIPREQYDVTPVEVTADGKWKVPLGSLPRSGPVRRVMDMFSKALRPLSPSQALQRLVQRPIHGLMTVVRGRGGDDGALHSLGNALGVPVVGSPPAACHLTSNKHMLSQAIGDVTSMPHSMRLKAGEGSESVIRQAQEEFVPPIFFKPTAGEGSEGIQRIESIDELASAAGASIDEDILVQEALKGSEIAVTLTEDRKGKVRTLPATVVVPRHAAYYDHLAKRRLGRVRLHTPAAHDNHVIAEAEAVARDVYDELGCVGLTTIDMVVGDGAPYVLEVNTIPTASDTTPLVHQLKAAGLHPSALLEEAIRRSWR